MRPAALFAATARGPARLPNDIVRRIHDDTLTVMRRADFQERLAKDGIDPVGNSPEEFAAQVRTDLAKWNKVVKAAGVKLD